MTLAAATVAGRDGRWMTDPGFGVYVHIPFCKHRCSYCDFNTYEGLDHLQGAYTDALVREIERWTGESRAATSVFFGGGTPTLLAPEALGRILVAVRDRFGLAAGAEVTVEANPETIDERSAAALLGAGFGRISIGVQSLSPNVLHHLDRTHPGEVALAAIEAARRAGFEDINADLIYGSPWESDVEWSRSLDGVIAAGVDHVSAYALTIEEGTPLATLIGTGRAPNVDPDVQAARYEMAQERLVTAGFCRYEVSNWARPGRASRHNVLYWSAGDYLGFGAGAHAHVAGHRWWTKRLPRDFIDAVDGSASTVDGFEDLVEDARSGEALMLGLRLRDGIDLIGFAARFGSESLARRATIVEDLVNDGWLERDGDRLKVSDRGTLLTNDICCRLL